MNKQGGYMGKILWVDLAKGSIHSQALDHDLAEKFVGGYGIGAGLLYQRMKPGVDALGPDNVLGFTTGPLTGTKAPMTSRHTVVGKSPLTGTWGDSNSGGFFANALKRSGWDCLFLEGIADSPVYLVIDHDSVQTRDASHLWGQDCRQTDRSIKDELGDESFRVVCIGPAGEKRSLLAGIVTEGGRIAARSGLGAVMGSKNLKAVAVRGSRAVPIANSGSFSRLVKDISRQLKHNLSPFGGILRELGTCGLLANAVLLQDAPIKNWSGTNDRDFTVAQAESIGGKNIVEYQKKRFGCGGCPVACGGVINLNNRKYRVVGGHKVEYETLAAFGSMCLVDDLPSIIYANELCNQAGIDTMSVGTAVAFAMECFERGLLSKEDLDGTCLTWGNAESMVKVVEAICRREGVGEILADGTRKAAEKIGQGSEQFAMHVAGQELPLHDPRLTPGYATTYCVDSTPARHTQSGSHSYDNGGHKVLFNELNLPEPERYDYKNKGEIHRAYANFQHTLSCAGLCIFCTAAIDYPVLDLMNAVTGWDMDLPGFLQKGESIDTIRHLYNLREGFKPSDFSLPRRVRGEPPLSGGPLEGRSIDVESMKLAYYQALGRNPDTGQVSRERLEKLGLGEYIQ